MVDVSKNSGVPTDLSARQLALPILPIDTCEQAPESKQQVEGISFVRTRVAKARLHLVDAASQKAHGPVDDRLACEGSPALAQLAGIESLLMLQGPIGPLFHRIATWKRSLGCRVIRIVFNGGDKHFCPDPEAVEFCHTLREWPHYLRRLIMRHQIDGVLLFGQSRPLHQEAIRICRLMGVHVFVMEEGYVRPGFMTLELGGVNAESKTLSRHRLAAHLPAGATLAPAKVKHHRLRMTGYAMLYYLFLRLGARYYAGYVHHRHTSIVHYARYWIGAALHYPLTRWRDRKALSALDERRPYFFVPLQIDSDAQVVFHSRFLGVLPFVDEVVRSFALHASPDAQLVIKQHPLARGHLGMRASILSLAERYGIRHRVIFVCSCKIYRLLEKVAGVVTINSTVGLQAIAHGAALKVMGDAVYDHPDVVDPQPLDTFWSAPRKPEPAKAARFHRELKLLTQVPVAIYDPSSVDLGWHKLLPSTEADHHEY